MTVTCAPHDEAEVWIDELLLKLEEVCPEELGDGEGDDEVEDGTPVLLEDDIIELTVEDVAAALDCAELAGLD